MVFLSRFGSELTMYRVVDDDGRDVEVGQEGELLLNGPIVFKGYHNNPEATKDAFDSAGYFRTGDVGLFRNGMFYIVDRKKELIKYKGAICDSSIPFFHANARPRNASCTCRARGPSSFPS